MKFSSMFKYSLILSTALTMGSCGAADKGATEKKSADITRALKVDVLDAGDFSSYFDVKSRKTPDDQARKALVELGFEKSETMDWGKMSGKDGTYQFQDLTHSFDEGRFTIENLEIMGVHGEGSSASFDRIDIENAKITSTDGGVFEIKTLSLAEPSADIAQAVLAGLTDMDFTKNRDEALDVEKLKISDFGNFMMKDVKILVEEGNANIDFLAWGRDDTNLARFGLNGLQAVISDDQDMTMNMTLDNISVDGLYLDYFEALVNIESSVGGNPTDILSKVNFFEPYFKTYEVKGMEIDMADLVFMAIPRMVGNVETSGKTSIMTQIMEPSTFRLADNADDPDLVQAKAMLTAFGIDDIVMSSYARSRLDEEADRINVEESYIKIDDLTQISMDYDLSGLAGIFASDLTTDTAALEAFDNMKLSSMNISIEDLSIVEKAFAGMSQLQGTTPQLLKSQAKGMLALAGLAAQNDAQREIVNSASTALVEFIDNGGTLSIGVNPDTDLTMEDVLTLVQAPDNFESLGLTIETKP